ncbi:hypothetical protein DUNSADRAFT_12147 [Dunaliella salina]|uniref:tRNA pseudouridine(55) synthase n=1 Tax=Dunaliella salina TaxID=3046 RepID=A0ABQ7GBW5_DUNSA|nr:hypothetical protein DUNSADRAFT_12147 [Dunaliella salina]|eukprot:KAF5832098.1 hypothetical protein DUNSADRAFT_12147 [Dunaliella salina]
MLSKPLAQHLGRPCVDSSRCDITLALTFDNPLSLKELHVLAEDELRMKVRKDDRGSKQQHQQQQQGKGKGKKGTRAGEHQQPQQQQHHHHHHKIEPNSQQIHQREQHQHQQQEECEALKHATIQADEGVQKGVADDNDVSRCRQSEGALGDVAEAPTSAKGAAAATDGGHAGHSTAVSLQEDPVDSAAAPASEAATAAAAAAAEAAASSVERAVQELVVTMNVDKVAAQLRSLPRHVAARLLSWPPEGPTLPCRVSFKLSRASVLLAGRYLKLQRNMPQTKWIDQATGKRIGGVSLAERVEAFVLPVFGAEASKFISGGREDADVRMLGEGRPFVMEIMNPRAGTPTEEQLRGVEKDLAAANNGAQVLGLKPCSKATLLRLKEAEESKEKTYQALCWCDRPLTGEDLARLKGIQNLEVMQDTPIRVLHRRASKVRPKYLSIEAADCLPGKPQYFNLRLRTQAGTYIKEFCHGDFGRSHPSLATILGASRAEILQLDVLAVHMGDWP